MRILSHFDLTINVFIAGTKKQNVLICFQVDRSFVKVKEELLRVELY